MNREQWLNDIAMRMGKTLFKQQGHDIPKNVRITCGFPSTKPLPGKKGFASGECWSADSSADGHFEIFISPLIEKPLEVASVLSHELVHACVGLDCNHGKPFKMLANRIGLTGPAANSVPGADFIAWFESQTDLTPYPHAAITPQPNEKKQTTRMHKVQCVRCGYVARVASKWIALGSPLCPCNRQPMQEAEPPKEDEAEGGS